MKEKKTLKYLQEYNVQDCSTITLYLNPGDFSSSGSIQYVKAVMSRMDEIDQHSSMLTKRAVNKYVSKSLQVIAEISVLWFPLMQLRKTLH